MAVLPLSRDVFQHEIASVRSMLGRWEAVLAGTHDADGTEAGVGWPVGLPAIDHPGSEEALAEMLLVIAGDLEVASSKCDALSRVLRDAVGG